MRTLADAIATEVALTYTRPGYLLEFGFSTPIRISTLGTLAWDGHTWLGGQKVDVQGLGWSMSATPRVAIGNLDLAFGAVVLGEGAADKSVKIWAVYAGAPDDAVPLFDGVADMAEVGDMVVMTLAQRGSRTLYSPRRFVGPSAGVNHLRPENTRITLGGATYVLQRA